MRNSSRESFPELPQMPAVLAEIPIGVLAAMISRTIFAISSEESRFTLNGALLLIRPEGVVMVSTDGHRLAYVESLAQTGEENRPFRALVPRKAMSEILKLSQEGEGDTKAVISGDDNHLFFQFGERLLITRKHFETMADLPEDGSTEITNGAGRGDRLHADGRRSHPDGRGGGSALPQDPGAADAGPRR